MRNAVLINTVNSGHVDTKLCDEGGRGWFHFQQWMGPLLLKVKLLNLAAVRISFSIRGAFG